MQIIDNQNSATFRSSIITNIITDSNGLLYFTQRSKKYEQLSEIIKYQ